MRNQWFKCEINNTFKGGFFVISFLFITEKITSNHLFKMKKKSDDCLNNLIEK